MNGPQPVEPVEVGVTGRAWSRSSTIAGRAEPVVDGRAARSAKTRDAIADALLDLLADGSFRPTARRSPSAPRSRSAPSTCTSTTSKISSASPPSATSPASRRCSPPSAVTGSPAERAHALVRQRIRLYAQAGAVARATRLHAAFSPTLARILREAQTRSRADLERLFAKELDALSAAHRTSTLAVLDVLTGPDAWETLRARHGLTGETAMHCVSDSIVLHLRAVSA